MLSKYRPGVNDDASDYNGRLETPLILKSHKAMKESDADVAKKSIKVDSRNLANEEVRISDPTTRFFDPDVLSAGYTGS